MFRRLGVVLIATAALAVVPAALAGYPSPWAAQGGEGVMSNDGLIRFVTFGAGQKTVVTGINTSDGSVWKAHAIDGSYGVPMLTQNGTAGGMFRDGSTFVLQSTGYHRTTSFRLISTTTLGPLDAIRLEGTFAFDALSPDGSRLYLIQHTSAKDLQHYVVRAYDLKRHTLLPGRIADKTQKSWVMQGWPAARTATSNGRWVYTLYANPGGYPFVHALDTVCGIAHCVGFAWTSSDQGLLINSTLAVKGPKLLVRMPSGQLYRVIDRQTWRVTKRL